MFFQPAHHALRARPALLADQVALSNLFHFEPYIFRHLDWKRPLDWLGEQPFVVAEQKGRIVAALICPPEPPGVAWLRAFAAAGQVHLETAWQAVWSEAYQMLTKQGRIRVAALCAENWMQKLLARVGFRYTGAVVVLDWNPSLPLPRAHFPTRPRVMLPSDLPEVYAVDKACFDPLWQNSEAILHMAFQQAVFATVVEDQAGIVGYQISTPSPQGGHLARLGVHPRVQGQGIGYALVHDVLIRFSNQALIQGRPQVTVNTQAENAASLAVYKKANFELTGHQYPVYEHFM
ncbi:MAG: hypothetical protein Fur0022_18700 [Anaerolineales bacterium]